MKATQIAILPLGFCHPGTGAAGDLPPRTECAPRWRRALMAHLSRLQPTPIIGRCAQDWHLSTHQGSLTDAVLAWRNHWPQALPLPHPSPRNTPWLKRNAWLEAEVWPALRARVSELLAA